MARIVFEDNEAWEAHLAEVEAEKSKAWHAGYRVGKDEQSLKVSQFFIDSPNPETARRVAEAIQTKMRDTDPDTSDDWTDGLTGGAGSIEAGRAERGAR